MTGHSIGTGVYHLDTVSHAEVCLPKGYLNEDGVDKEKEKHSSQGPSNRGDGGGESEPGGVQRNHYDGIPQCAESYQSNRKLGPPALLDTWMVEEESNEETHYPEGDISHLTA